MRKRFDSATVGLLVAAAAFAVLQSGCQDEKEVELRSLDPEAHATGEAELRVDNLGKCVVKLHVRGLPRPAVADEGAKHYVLWAQPTDGEPEHLGVLGWKEGESEELVGVTELEKFALMLTAEKEEEPERPGLSVMMSDPTKVKDE